MKAKSKTKQDLLMEVEELRRRLDEIEQTRSKEILNEAELNRLASFPQLNPNSVVEVDPAGHVHYSNPAADQLFPDLRKAGLNHPFLVDLNKIGKTLNTGSRKAYVREIRIGDCWYSQRIHSVLEGERLRIYGFDVTTLKRIEEEREKLRVDAENEKRRLEAVMEALPVGVALTDPQGGTLTFNKAFEQVWGAPRPRTESFNDYAAYKAWWSETGKPVAPEEWASAQTLQKGHAVVGQLMEIAKFDGSRASVINSGAPVFDAEGKISGCAVAIQDITDLRRMEKALRESNARTETILRSISDGFLTLDNDLVLTYFSQAAENLLGRKQEDVLGRNLFDAFPQARGSIFEEKYSWALKQKKPTAFETFFGVKPYENWYDVRVYPHEYGISVYFRVTTEEKKATDAIRRSKERFELLAETASKLLATQNPQGMVKELCQKVMTHLDCHAFFNYLVDENFHRLHLNAWAGIPEQTAQEIGWLGYGVAVCGCAARDAARIVCENIPVTPDPRTELVKSFGIKAYACHPLFSEGRVIGTLSFGTRSRTTFTEEELSLMKTVADQVATAMDRIRMTQEIEQSRDDLERRVLERTEELKNANETLKAERKLFYDVLETIPAYVVLLTSDYHATFANRTFTERFGESKGRRCFEFLFELSEPCETCETYTALKTMAPHQWEWAGPDGRIYFVHDFPFTDVDGSTLILEMGIDITERKRAERSLRDASLYTRNLIEVSLDPLVTISSDGKIMDVNRATELVTGVPRDELIGTDFSDYFTEPEKARQGYRQVFLEGFVRDYPLAIRHRSGKVTDVLYNATVYRNEAGGVQGVFAAARDITERKRAEEELRDKESRLRFFASKYLTAQETERRRIAAELHDSIASALAGLKFRVERTGEDMKRGQSDIQSIKDLSSSLSQTIGEVRRIMADLRPSILDDLGILPALSWFCREYEKTYSHLSVDKKIGISEEDVPNSLKTVIFRISQEAMSNVARHSEASLVGLGLHKTGDRLELTIQDNGHGFQPSEAMKGLGLSTMRERAELAGGTFTIQSTSGKGTIIRASWPLAL
jgi:PAS domain S-box-containing protein